MTKSTTSQYSSLCCGAHQAPSPNGNMSWKFNRALEAAEREPMLDDESSWLSVISPDSIPKGGSREKKKHLIIKQLDEMMNDCH